MGCKVFKDREKGMVRGCKGEKKGKREGKGCAHVYVEEGEGNGKGVKI